MFDVQQLFQAPSYASLVLLWLNVFALCYTDFITVSETAVEPPQDEEGMNSPTDLAMEATFINQNFSQQVLKRVSYAKSSLFTLSLCYTIFVFTLAIVFL